jgi:hypothetical protein
MNAEFKTWILDKSGGIKVITLSRGNSSGGSYCAPSVRSSAVISAPVTADSNAQGT